jgi:hypothetical protein
MDTRKIIIIGGIAIIAGFIIWKIVKSKRDQNKATVKPESLNTK